MQAFPKPKDLEGKITLSLAQRRKKRLELYYAQGGICGCGCGKPMSLELDRMDTCTLEHHEPQPMGCKKRDNPDNLFSVWRWDCNSAKGSKRLSGGVQE